jgi:hypothetical protein
MQDSFDQPNGQSTTQLIVDQLEELIATLYEEIRERPGVALAIVAAVVGALVGAKLATGRGRRSPPKPEQVVKRARGMAEAADLAGLGVKLLQNPLVRGYVWAAVEGQFKKRFS